MKKFSMPVHWVSYIKSGCTLSLKDTEIKIIDDVLSDLKDKGFLFFDIEESEFFSYNPDFSIDGLACVCYNYLFEHKKFYY